MYKLYYDCALNYEREYLTPTSDQLKKQNPRVWGTANELFQQLLWLLPRPMHSGEMNADINTSQYIPVEAESSLLAESPKYCWNACHSDVCLLVNQMT